MNCRKQIDNVAGCVLWGTLPTGDITNLTSRENKAGSQNAFNQVEMEADRKVRLTAGFLLWEAGKHTTYHFFHGLPYLFSEACR